MTRHEAKLREWLGETREGFHAEQAGCAEFPPTIGLGGKSNFYRVHLCNSNLYAKV
jgi:hypothetical protein